MCGIVGLFTPGRAVNQGLFDALTVLQHRGQDAAGIVTCQDKQLFLRKANGLARDVFHMRHMLRLKGDVGIGHVRYPTAGSSSEAEAQPFYVNSPYGITLAHNGNLTNADELKTLLFREDLRHINTRSDSEILLNIFAHELNRLAQLQMKPEDVFSAVKQLHARCRGGYAAIAMIVGYGLVAFRDPHGIRPLIFGKRTRDNITDYMIASESVALDALGFTIVDDVQPGEAIFISLDGQVHRKICADKTTYTPCIFEYVYLARPDSIMDNIGVYQARLRMGEKLADRILAQFPNHDVDVVIPVPDTSRTAALPIAEKLKVKYTEGFIKNRYIGRTFIMPGQQERKKSVRQKLNPITMEFKDKNVLLIDDSIVRGTTSREIIQMARDAGAKKVYFASAAPAIRYPNVYGIDMPSAQELIAHGRNETQIGEALGADRIFYQTLDDLIEAIRDSHPNIQQFEASVFDGHYVTGDIDAAYLEHLALQRSDASKGQDQMSSQQNMLDLTNTQ